MSVYRLSERSGGVIGTIGPIGGSGVFSLQERYALTADNYENVSLYLKMNGANGSTTFYDSSLHRHAVTANGNAQISTAQSKFGGASAAFDGSGDGLLLPASQELALGTGDFTIEMWVNGANSTALVGGSFPRLFTLGTAQGTGCIEVYNSSSPAGVTVAISADTNIIFSGSTLLDSTWRHFAITRAGTSLKAFVDGVQVGSTNTNSTNLILAATTASYIGAASESVGNFNGYIDDLRITKGVARYTGNFTPPQREFRP